MYHLAIASASRSILIANPYFVPNTLAVGMLVEARRRGVQVEIIVPGPITDAGLVRRASRAKWGPLLEAGVRIYEYQPTMYHNKVMVVDDYWVSVGSANFDNRSFRLNDEANLNVFDEAFARAQAGDLRRDRERSRQVTLEEWRGRPITERLEEMVARVLRRQMWRRGSWSGGRRPRPGGGRWPRGRRGRRRRCGRRRSEPRGRRRDPRRTRRRWARPAR